MLEEVRVGEEELAVADFERFLALIYKVSGIRIPNSKKVMIANRVRRRLRATGIPTFADYYTHLVGATAATEMPAFIDAITTNETYFYRDAQHFEWFGGTFLAEAARASRPRGQPIRVWSAACSTGEEPYTLALEILANRPALAGREISILGTDLSGAAIEAARLADYDERAVHLVPADRRKLGLDHDADRRRWTVRPEVRSLVSWKIHNLLKPVGQGPFDCVFIKNVLIYFDAESKQAVVRHLLASLAPGGYLVVGPTEGIFGMLGALDKRRTFLYQNKA
jgi:chemotaxis protein methyltransferase CheR